MTTALAPAPVAPPVPDAGAAADPAVAFNVRPRFVTEEGAGLVAGIVIMPDTDASKYAVERLKHEASGECLEHLERVRAAFFASGDGAVLLERKGRLRAAEEAVRGVEGALAELRQRWTAAVATDSAKDVGQLENEIDAAERKRKRLEVRVPVLKDEYDACRAECRAKLRARLTAARAEFTESARIEADAKLADLRDAIHATYLDWLRANAVWNGGLGVHTHPLFPRLGDIGE